MKVVHSTPSFAQLVQRGFYPDILAAMSGFMAFMHKKKMCALGLEIVETFASGFLTVDDFSTKFYQPKPEDPFFDLKRSYLVAVDSIYSRFGDRLPIQFYSTLAFMTLRTNPVAEERIPELEHLLQDGMDWQVADSVLHALPLCSRLYFHAQTEVNQVTGRILGHGCGCGCGMPEMPTCVVRAPMGDSMEVLVEETEAFFRHAMAQLFVLRFGLPQGMGVSQKLSNLNERNERSGLRAGEQSAIEKLQLRSGVHAGM